MKFCLITNIISPHQMPLAYALVNRIGEADFRYVATEQGHDERKRLGWGHEGVPEWLIQPFASAEARREADDWMEESAVVLCGNREFDRFEKRSAAGRLTLYMSERWFKPPFGMLRLLHPQYLRMALRFLRLLHSPSFYHLPIGIHAAEDVLRMVRLFAFLPKWLLCYFRLPTSDFRLRTRQLRSKLLLWGYFVESSVKLHAAADKDSSRQDAKTQRLEDGDRMSGIGCRGAGCCGGATNERMHSRTNEILQVLWAGRMLKLKRADTLIKAVDIMLSEGRDVRLTLVGHGPEEDRLRKLAETVCNKQLAKHNGSTNALTHFRTNELPPITFHPPVPIAQVRELMRQADVYVFSSAGGEGWGAVVNEALEEGCVVVASRECGSGPTMIKHGENGLLFKSGRVQELADRLRQLYDEPEVRLGMAREGQETMRLLWSPDVGADRLLAICEAVLEDRNAPDYDEGPLQVLPC